MVPTIKGVYVRDGDHWEIIGQREGLNSNVVFAALEDREGGLLVGLGGAGLDYLPRFHDWKAWTSDQALPSDVVWRIATDRQRRLWVGTNEGLALFDKGLWRVFGKKDGLGGNIVRRIAISPDGAIWVASLPG